MQIGLYSDATQFDNDGEFEHRIECACDDGLRSLHASSVPMEQSPARRIIQNLIDGARSTGQQVSSIVDPDRETRGQPECNGDSAHKRAGQRRWPVLVVTIARSGMVEAQQHIRTIAYGVAAGGILLAIAFSLWIAARVSRPIEQLAHAAEEVAGGNWDVRVAPCGHDEVSVLAHSFNHMTEQLRSQRDRLVQSERVAAWRELARRLAHELKNPIFPLQLTVENLVRARAFAGSGFR